MNPEFVILYRENIDLAVLSMKQLNQKLVTAYDATDESNYEKRIKLGSTSSLLAEHIKTIEWAGGHLHLECAMTVYRQLVQSKKYEKIIKGIEKNVLE